MNRKDYTVTTTKNTGKLAHDLTEAELIADVKAYIEQAGSLITLRKGSDRPYLRVDGWQYIIQKHGLIPLPDDAIKLEDGGYLVRCTLVDEEGVIKGRGEMSCGSKGDSPWDKRSDNDQRAMAQTRSIGRAGRNRFAWLVVACGYNSTHAEELPEDDSKMISYQKPQPSSAPAPTSNGTVYVGNRAMLCPRHNEEWIPMGNGAAHKTGEVGPNGKNIFCDMDRFAKEQLDILLRIQSSLGMSDQDIQAFVTGEFDNRGWTQLCAEERQHVIDNIGQRGSPHHPESPQEIEREMLGL